MLHKCLHHKPLSRKPPCSADPEAKHAGGMAFLRVECLSHLWVDEIEQEKREKRDQGEVATREPSTAKAPVPLMPPQRKLIELCEDA